MLMRESLLDRQVMAATEEAGIALEMLRPDRPVPEVYTALLQPAQYEVGRRWERNEISVAQEHMATAVTQYVLAELYSRLEIPESTRGGLVVTGVEGELHQVGAHMIADILEADGWNVRFLGTQMPHRDILSTIEEHRPRIVGISITMLFNLPRARALIDNIAGQWLLLRELDTVSPVTKAFDGNLRYSFRRETELLFETIPALAQKANDAEAIKRRFNLEES